MSAGNGQAKSNPLFVFGGGPLKKRFASKKCKCPTRTFGLNDAVLDEFAAFPLAWTTVTLSISLMFHANTETIRCRQTKAMLLRMNTSHCPLAIPHRQPCSACRAGFFHIFSPCNCRCSYPLQHQRQRSAGTPQPAGEAGQFAGCAVALLSHQPAHIQISFELRTSATRDNPGDCRPGREGCRPGQAQTGQAQSKKSHRPCPTPPSRKFQQIFQ